MPNYALMMSRSRGGPSGARPEEKPRLALLEDAKTKAVALPYAQAMAEAAFFRKKAL